MGLSSNILGGIMKMGYKVPTPIQRKALPVALSGRDVVAMARTGAWGSSPWVQCRQQETVYHVVGCVGVDV